MSLYNQLQLLKTTVLSKQASNTVASSPPTTNTLTLQANTRATDNFVRQSETSHLQQVPTSLNNPAINVIVPNREQTMQSNSTMHLPIPTLPPSAIKAHGFNNLASGSLLSVGNCDANCTANYTDTKMNIYNKTDVKITPAQTLIITGARDAPHRPLLTVQLSCHQQPFQPIQHLINVTIVGAPSLSEQIAFSHASMFSLPLQLIQDFYLHDQVSLQLISEGIHHNQMPPLKDIYMHNVPT